MSEYDANNYLKATAEPAYVQRSRDQLHARWAARKAQEERQAKIGRAALRVLGGLVVGGFLYHVGACVYRSGLMGT